MKLGILYEIRNKLNDKKYIGVTYRKLSERWNDHKSRMKNGDKRPLYNSMRKYGIENFEIKPLMEDVPSNYLEILEKLWIQELDLQNRSKGYNLADGGKVNKGYKIPKEVVEKRSKLITGKGNPFYGKHHSEETKMKISKAKKGLPSPNKGKKLSEETKNKISQSKKGINTATEQTKKIWHEQRKGENNSSAKAVFMIDKNTDEVLRTFKTMKEAVEWIVDNTDFEMKVMRSMVGSIVRVCKNKTKTAYGFKWKYVE